MPNGDYKTLLKMVDRLSSIEQKVIDIKEDVKRQEVESKEIHKVMIKRFEGIDKKVENNSKYVWMVIGGISTIIMVIQALSWLNFL